MRQLKITKSITKRESQSLEKYLQEISRTDLLTAEREIELAKNIRAGDAEAIEELAKANLRFVVSVAKQYQNQWMPLSDLISEGNAWLMKAATRFDETKWFKFISYAVWRIRQSILKALADNSRVVRLPLNKIGEVSKMRKARSSLEQEYEREPSIHELAETLEITENSAIEAMYNEYYHISLDAPFVEGEENNTILDTYQRGDERTTDHELKNVESLQRDIETVLGTLWEREAYVLKMFFGIGMERKYLLDEIGDNLGITIERARQIKEIAIRRLRRASRRAILQKYLW